MPTGFIHQALHLRLIEEGWRSPAPMQLFHRSPLVEQCTLLFNFKRQTIEITRSMRLVFCHHLVASAIEADRRAKRNVEIQRQRGGLGCRIG